MSGQLHILRSDHSNTTVTWTKSGPPSLEILQREVGGYIEHIRVHFLGKMRDAYVDEDGHSKLLPLNLRATALWGGNLRGPLVVWVPDSKSKSK